MSQSSTLTTVQQRLHPVYNVLSVMFSLCNSCNYAAQYNPKTTLLVSGYESFCSDSFHSHQWKERDRLLNIRYIHRIRSARQKYWQTLLLLLLLLFSHPAASCSCASDAPLPSIGVIFVVCRHQLLFTPTLFLTVTLTPKPTALFFEIFFWCIFQIIL